MDSNDLEKERGITVFSKQANVTYNESAITFLDTPGHVDFSAEMERTLQVLDVAVLVISCMDGIAGHTATLWKLLKSYNIPTIIFVNKMDQNGADKDAAFALLKDKLGDGIIDFTDYESFGEETLEEMSLCSEELLDIYMAEGAISKELISEAIYNRKMFPVLFGSALKIEGVEELLLDIKKKLTKYIDLEDKKIYIVGGGAKLQGIDEIATRILQAPVGVYRPATIGVRDMSYVNDLGLIYFLLDLS